MRACSMEPSHLLTEPAGASPDEYLPVRMPDACHIRGGTVSALECVGVGNVRGTHEWAPRCQAEAVRAVDRRIVLLDFDALEEVVLGLLRDGSDEAEAVSDLPCLLDEARRPLGGAPVEGEAAVDDVVHGPHLQR